MKQNQFKMIAMILIIVASFIYIANVTAEPEGATVQYISNTTKNVTDPDSRTDNKGTITTVLLNTMQQNIKWKAYVGNVSGTLILRDADQYTLYQWPSGGSPDGEVYLTRNNTIDWETIQCANYTEILAEQTVLGHTAGAIDNINNTFSGTLHEQFDVGTIPIAESDCKSTVTWVNDTAQSVSTTALYQEVLLMDASARIVYAALMDPDAQGYDNTSSYDFQAIVPDFTTSSIATYYFYVEISG